MKKINGIILILCLALLGTSIYYGLQSKNRMEMINIKQEKIDDMFKEMLWDITLAWDYSEMSEKEISECLIKDATICEQAGMIFEQTSYARCAELGNSLSFFNVYLTRLSSNQDKIDEDTMDSLFEEICDIANSLNFYPTMSENYEDEELNKYIKNFSEKVDKIYANSQEW